MNNIPMHGLSHEESRRSQETYPAFAFNSASNKPTYPESYRVTTNRLGPQRTSFVTQKLKLLPEDQQPGADETGRDAYSQVTKIEETPARKDAEKLGKAHRELLPRVTAYCTASSYRMKDLAKFLAARKANKANPKVFDECIYSPYSYTPSFNEMGLESPPHRNPNEPARLIRIADEGGEIDVDAASNCGVFLFEYGVTIFWGFTEVEEKRFLNEISKFENEKLAVADVQVEEFNYYITNSYQPRVSSV